jgi:hypothetical protein
LELKKAVWANRCVAIPLKMRILMIEETEIKKLKESHMIGYLNIESLLKSPLKGV